MNHPVADPVGPFGIDRTAPVPWEALNLTYLLERTGVDPKRPAVVCDDVVRTYADMRDRYRRVANGLAARGIASMDRVAITTKNRVEYLEVEVGIAGCGAIMVPLSWRLAPPERVGLLARCQARAVFAEDGFVVQLAAARAAGELPDLELIISFGPHPDADLDYERFCATAATTRPPQARLTGFSDPHEIIYTSGTTGDPKGVVWAQGTVMWNAIQQALDFRLGPDHANYVALDLNYIGGRHDFTFALLYQGGTVHIRPSGGFDPGEAVRYIVERQVSHVLWVPTMIYDVMGTAEANELDTSCLEMIMCGGAPLSAQTVVEAQAVFPGTKVVQVYGLTEGGGTTTFVPAEYLETKIGSAGKASMHNEIRIVDPVDGHELPAGEEGEIVLRGPAVTLGYWDNPRATAAAIRDGWLHTGDLGRLDADDFLFVSGRQKDMIISGGMNIYPSEVEGVLRTHPGVRDVAVIGLPHERWGEQVCAVVIREDGSDVSGEEIIEFARANLASFKKPSEVRFVESFPMTISGKVRKFELRDSVLSVQSVTKLL